MLIGIDMIGVQGAGGGRGESARYGRQLVRALLARDRANRYVLYAHDGLPVASIPSSPNARRLSLPSGSGRSNARRAATQRLLDRDPDGLDWLILLDPFAAAYDGLPPEAPLGGPRVASIVHDLTPPRGQDRRLVPLRRHDAILAASEETASAYRNWMGPGAGRVATIGLATDEPFAPIGSAEPLTRCSGAELGGLGIRGPFLLTRLSGRPSRPELVIALDGYRRLPVEYRRGYQLVVVGPVDEPAEIRSFLREHGADEGLVLVGEADESTLARLYGRCSAFLAPSAEGGSGLSMVEALTCGAPVIAVRSPASDAVVGDAGRLVDSPGPIDLSPALADLLGDEDLSDALRRRAVDRAARFSFDGVVEALLGSLAETSPGLSSGFRGDRGHGARDRVAVFLDVDRDATSLPDFDTLWPDHWLEASSVDFYLDPGLSTLADGFPVEVGGFDSRLFDRNDAILGYRAVVYQLGSGRELESKLGRIVSRPGLVLLGDEPWLDRVRPGAAATGSAPDPSMVRPLLQSGSRVVARSPRILGWLAEGLPDFADRIVEVPPFKAWGPTSDAERSRARARLDFLPDTLVIGVFGRFGGPVGRRRVSRVLDNVARSNPQAILLSFDADFPTPGHRFVTTGPLSSDEARSVIPALDLGIFLGDSQSATLPGLLRAGVAAIAIDADPPATVAEVGVPPVADSWRRQLVRLGNDPGARSALLRSATAHCFGVPDAPAASRLLRGLVESCDPGARRHDNRATRTADGPRGLIHSPHFVLAASARGDAASRLR